MAFETAHGSLTETMQSRYLHREIREGRMDLGVLEDDRVMSLQASPDGMLFFWQLHSLLGTEPVHKLLDAFYTRVFEGEDDLFRQTFEGSAGFHYQVVVQSNMYTDCFGGGKLYRGGMDRTHLHHSTLGKKLMNREGADRWHDVMVEALDEMTPEFDAVDKRIRPTMNTFLAFFMEHYGSQFGFDTSGLKFGAS